jgi:hypothetical protein
VHPSEQSVPRRVSRGKGRYVETGKDAFDELTVLFGDHRFEVRRSGVDDARRHDDVDAVGPAFDVLIDPGERGLQLIDGEGDRAEDAHAAGLADFDDDFLAPREREDGVLDAKVSQGVRIAALALRVNRTGVAMPLMKLERRRATGPASRSGRRRRAPNIV